MSEIREIPAVPAVPFPRNDVTVTRMFENAQRNIGEPALWKTQRRRRKPDHTVPECDHPESTLQGWAAVPVAPARHGSADILVRIWSGFRVSDERKDPPAVAGSPGFGLLQPFVAYADFSGREFIRL